MRVLNLRNCSEEERRNGRYIGRNYAGAVPSNPQEYGGLGNPCAINKVCPVCNTIHRESGETIPCFEKYARARMDSDTIFRQEVLSLEPYDLLCFCSPRPCHGNIYAKLIEEYKER